VRLPRTVLVLAVVFSIVAAWVPQVAAQVGGSGKPNYIPIWSKTKTLTNSSIFETNGGKVGINTTAPTSTLDVKGGVVATSFVGNGSGLSNLQGANVQGAVATADNATTANTANTANNALALGGLPPSAYALAGSLPSIVASVALTNQTANIPLTTLVTPTQNTLYRVSGYLTCGTFSYNNTISGILSWTDDYSPIYQYSLPGYCNGPPNPSPVTFSYTLMDTAGSPLSYQTTGCVSDCLFELFITVEQLPYGNGNTRKAKMR
jgi:hypothetical protein